MSIPAIEWDEASPSGNQIKSLGADRIRELKTQFREIFGVDHIISSSGSGDAWGYHNKCTFYNRTVDSIPSADTGCLYSKDYNSKSALYWVDETDTNIEMQLTDSLGFVGGMVGEVRIFSGLIANIPGGWALCDGVSNPLNLVGKFVRGISNNSSDPTGVSYGADEITLTTMPAHTHTATSSYTVTDHTHSMTYYLTEVTGKGTTSAPSKWYVDYSNYSYSARTDEGTSSHSDHSGTSSGSGSGTAFDNRPAYREEVFIIKT